MYNYASDPLLLKLNKVLKGLTYFRHPTSGPHHPLFGKPKPVEEKLTALGFVDDVKGFLTSVEEFHLLDKTLASFEAALAPGSTDRRTRRTRSVQSWL